jgi:hypothetical protein
LVGVEEFIPMPQDLTDRRPSAIQQSDLPAIPRQPGAGARLVTFEPWPHPNPSLVGHATVDFSGWVVSRIPIFRRSNGSLSAGVPSCPQVDTDGRVRVDAEGKRQYAAVITFTSRDGKARYEKIVLGALADAEVAP